MLGYSAVELESAPFAVPIASARPATVSEKQTRDMTCATVVAGNSANLALVDELGVYGGHREAE
jgi:hypothetical protein